MGLTRGQWSLLGAALGLTLVLLLLVPPLTEALGPRTGFLAVLGLYWLLFCIPVILLFIAPDDRAPLFSFRTVPRWVPVAVAVQLALIAVAAFVPNLAVLSPSALAVGALIGLVNGPLEEAAWRGGFLSTFRDNRRVGFWACWVLFTLWHIPLSMSAGIVFDGGTPTLIGGAAALGLFWTFLTFRTGTVAWSALAHALTNVLTFSVLVAANSIA